MTWRFHLSSVPLYLLNFKNSCLTPVLNQVESRANLTLRLRRYLRAFIIAAAQREGAFNLAVKSSRMLSVVFLWMLASEWNWIRSQIKKNGNCSLACSGGIVCVYRIIKWCLLFNKRGRELCAGRVAINSLSVIVADSNKRTAVLAGGWVD